ncbi:MAG: OmpA family protein [Bacteroidota bacterium]
MKKFITLLFILLPTLLLAQEPLKKTWDNWSLNVNGGQTLFIGDISKNFEFYRPSLEETASAFGIILSKDLSCVFSLRGQLMYGSLYGKKDVFKGGGAANRYFKAIYWNYNINTAIDLARLFGKCDPDRKFSFYGVIGIGFTNFKTKLYNTLTDQVIASWGYGRPEDGTHYWVTDITVPIGLGMSYKIGKRFSVSLESTLNMVNTEKLDATKGMFSKDGYYYTSVGITYNLSKWNRVCDCKKMLNESNNNNYIYKTSKDTVWIKENNNTLIKENNQNWIKENYPNDRAISQIIQMQKEIDSLKMANKFKELQNGMQKEIDSLKNSIKFSQMQNGMQYIIDSLKKRIELNDMQNEIDNLRKKLQDKPNYPDNNYPGNINKDKPVNNKDQIYDRKDKPINNKDKVINNIVDKVIDDVKDSIERSGYLLYSVYFDVNKWDIKPSERIKVAAVAETLDKNPTLKVKIIGNADRQGGYNYNIWLSKKRAEAVAKMLTNEYDIPRSRYVLDWRGYTEPLSSKYFYINRRVDFLKLNP